jgi:hypothetical protein
MMRNEKAQPVDLLFLCCTSREREPLHCSCKGALCATPFCGPREGAVPLNDDSNQKAYYLIVNHIKSGRRHYLSRPLNLVHFCCTTIFYGKRCNFLRPPPFLLFTSVNAIYHVTCQGHTGAPGCGGKGNILEFSHTCKRELFLIKCNDCLNSCKLW